MFQLFGSFFFGTSDLVLLMTNLTALDLNFRINALDRNFRISKPKLQSCKSIIGIYSKH